MRRVHILSGKTDFIHWLDDYRSAWVDALTSLGVPHVLHQGEWTPGNTPQAGDIAVLVDFDDLHLLAALPKGVTKLTHGHGVSLFWLACNEAGETQRELDCYAGVDIVTLNTENQKRQILAACDLPPDKFFVSGYPLDLKKRGYGMTHQKTREERTTSVVCANRLDGDAQHLLQLQGLMVAGMTASAAYCSPTRRPRAVLLYGEDAVARWEKGMDFKLEQGQASFWQKASNARAFLTTGNHHTLNLSLLEANIMGCVPVVPDIPLYREFLDPDAACFYEPWSLCSMAAELQRAVSRKDAPIAFDPTRFAHTMVVHRVLGRVGE